MHVDKWAMWTAIVLFKCLGSRHIHIKEIKLQKAMNGIDKILCKMDPILIRRFTYI